MKRNLTKLLLLFVVMVVGVLSANAKEDVTTTYLNDAALENEEANWALTSSGGNHNWNADNKFHESWHNTFSVSQTISIPNGYYQISIQAVNDKCPAKNALLEVTSGDETASAYIKHSSAGNFADISKNLKSNPLACRIYATIKVENGSLSIKFSQTKNDEWIVYGQFKLEKLTEEEYDNAIILESTLEEKGDAWSGGWTNGGNQYIFARERYLDAEFTTGKIIHKTISDLPSGYYDVTLLAKANNAWVAAATGNDIAEVYANEGKYSIPVQQMVAYDLTTDWNYTISNVRVDGNLEIGIRNIANGGNWYTISPVNLVFRGGDLADYEGLFTKAKNAANSIDQTKKMEAVTLSNLQSAISTYGKDFSSYTDVSSVKEAIKTFNNTVKKASKSIVLYEKIKANIDDCKAKYTGVNAATIEKKYNEGNYANDEDADVVYSEFANLFITANNEPAADADFTLAIVNPSFELGNTYGWTHGSSSETGAFEKNMSNKDGKYVFNTWWWGVPIRQTLENLPNGVYRLSAVVASSDGNDTGRVYLTANDEYKGMDCPKGTENVGRKVSLSTIVSDGKLTIGAIGAKVEDLSFVDAESNVWWYKADDFRLTFVDTKDNYIAALKAQLTEEDAQTAFETAANAATTVDAIDAAFQTAIRTQKTEGADYTATIVNPSFETGDLTGWTLNSSSYDKGVVKSEGNKATTNVDGTYYFNIWDWEGKGGDPITQTIDLPNGTYKLTAVAASGDGNTVLLTANGGNAEIPCTGDANGIEGELTFAVTNGKAIIGAEGKDKCWYKADNFRLEYVRGIEEVDNITDLAATTGEAIFSMTDWEVIVAGEDSIIAQNMTSDTPAGIMLKGTKTVDGANTAAIDKVISGQVYGTYDADTHIFTVKTNSGNKFEAANGETALTKRDIATAKEAGNVYLYTVIEDATIVDKEGNFYATVGNDEILIDKHFNADLVLNNGDVVNSITGITILNEDGTNCALAPLSQDDIVPVLWSAENIEEGEVRDDKKPIDLITDNIMKRMENLAAGDVLKVKVVEDNHMDSRGQRRAIALRGTVAVTTASDLGVFYIPFYVYEESTTVEVPITADILKEVNDKGLKIAVKGANASMVTVSNAVYTAEETENSIWLSKDANEVTLGEYHFGDVRKNDVLTAEGESAKMAIIVEDGDNIDVTSGQALTADEATALQDNELSVEGATKVAFTLGDDPRNDKFEVPENEDGTYDSFAQGAQVTDVDGMIMTFGGNDPEGAAYEFEEAYPEVNKFGSATEGINTFPVDDEDKAYDPEVKNLPTKGTYYVFEPTKDGKLDVTVGLEQGKKLFVTEDGEAMKDYNGVTTVKDNMISIDVEATKTYYVFANETNLEYYGFTFVPTTDCENIAKDIATFKLVPEDNADGDTLLLKDAVVTYINGDDIFVEDASGATTFFRTNIQFYVGQKLNGYIIGQNHEREFLPQLLKVEGKTTYKTFEVTENVTPEAKVISVADASKEENIGRFVKLENLEVSKDDRGFTVLFDPETENSIRIEDHFNVFYTLNRIVRSAEGIVGVNKEGTIIFWPTSKEGVDSPNPLFTEGYYVFRNVASGLYLGAGNSWGTQATLLDYSESQKLIGIDDFTYKMESQVSNGGTSYYFNGSYMDGNSAAELTFAKKDDYYTISVGGKFLGNSTTAAYTTGQYALGLDVDGESEDALWEVVPATKAALAKATEEAPVDATFLIKNPNFGRNNRNSSAWTMEASNKNLCGGKDENKCAESWHAVFTLSQKLENMPKGVYELTAQGFYGQDGSDNEHLPVFYANDATQTFQKRTGSENSMDLASQSFAKGLYKSEPIFFELAGDGDITIGTKLEGNTALWCIWDNFQLKYYGPDASFAAIKNAAILAQLDELRKKAADLAEVVDFASAKTALDNALNSTADVDRTSETAINAAIVTLNGAIAEGDTYKKAKNALAHMKELTESTNFYTKESYDKYYSTWLAKYEDGTLTKDEANTLQDPTVVTTWHAQITVDDMLLSVWDTNPDFQDAPYYINTWSVEGDSDGSNFHVPFFEYWTGDGNSLEPKTLTATVNGLEAGAYDVTAWVRVRMKNGAEAPAYGIEMQVNNGTPVDVAAGQQVGTTQFYLDNFTASGIVGADGVLTLKFNVAEDNNISWLSFKNVKYTGSSTDGISDVVRYKSGAVYNLNGQKVNKDLKPGLYIINGQKRVVK